MSLREKDYKERLIDKKIDRYLETFGAILIEGPKWCGKTWTALNHAESASYVTETSTKRLALINPKNIFSDERPQLIDEWQIVPSIWDSVRHECDRGKGPGNFILTGSTTLRKEIQGKQVYHSGAGRIARLKMETMSLFESGDSSGVVSITDMLENKNINKNTGEVKIRELASLLIRGGWPESLKVKKENSPLIPKSYIESILNVELDEEDKIRDKNKMNMLLKSLARNESTIVSNKTLIKDIEEYEAGEAGNDILSSRTTLLDYLDFLERLHLIENQESYSSNYPSPERVRKSVKRHFVDPSLSCSLLNLNEDKLMNDLNTFGFLFEALVERDLRIYMDYLDGKIYHFRDNVSGLEVDTILEFEDGEYAAVEIKLGYNEVDDAIKNLKEFYNNMTKKPKFMCIIVGVLEAAYKDPDTSIYVVPITALKP